MLAAVGATVSVRAQQTVEKGLPGADSMKPCVVVFGAVYNPGSFELRRQVRLSELLVLSGGLTGRVDRTVQVIRSGTRCFQPTRYQVLRDSDKSGTPEVYDLSDVLHANENANPYLRPGDIVIATEIGPIYVTGNVNNPQAIFRKEPLTLTRAIELAGGVLPDTRINRVAIYRAPEGRIGREVIRADLKAIKKHREEDPILQPYDVINVPNKRGDQGGDVTVILPPKLATRIIE